MVSPRLLALPILALPYLMVLQHPSPWDLPAAVLLAELSIRLSARGLPAGWWEREAGAPALWARLARGPGFALAVLREIVIGVTGMIRIALRGRLPTGGLVEVPMGARSPVGVAVSGWLATLSPGTVLVRLDWERRTLVFHVVDASDPDAVRARIERFYEAHQRRVVP